MVSRRGGRTSRRGKANRRKFQARSLAARKGAATRRAKKHIREIARVRRVVARRLGRKSIAWKDLDREIKTARGRLRDAQKKRLSLTARRALVKSLELTSRRIWRAIPSRSKGKKRAYKTSQVTWVDRLDRERLDEEEYSVHVEELEFSTLEDFRAFAAANKDHLGEILGYEKSVGAKKKAKRERLTGDAETIIDVISSLVRWEWFREEYRTPEDEAHHETKRRVRVVLAELAVRPTMIAVVQIGRSPKGRKMK